MTKLLRFAGVALLALTIGVFGCGEDAVAPLPPTVTVTVPTPPTPPTPPPPPVVVTMSPASQTIGVGGTVVFAVSVSGGVAGEAATWTCASSDPSKATVTTTSAGCQATAVAAGGVTITAAVTKGGATVNTGAGLTITEDMAERAFLVLASITDSDEDDEVLSGKVSVELSVERGDQMLVQLSVLVDGVVAATLPFGGASAVAASQDEPAQQAVHAFVLSFNSAEYDAVTGVPTYMNGEHTISAELMVASSDEPLGSGLHAREFGNDDGYVVTADLGGNSAIGDDGRQWYGGPGNGTIDIAALPVSYSDGSVTTVSANFCGEDVTDSDGADGYAFEFECEDRESNTDADEGAVGDMLTLSSPGEAGVILNDDHPFPAFVDFVGPTNSPIIVANRNGRENGWLNATVALTGEVDDDDDDNWLVEGTDMTGGIGGYNMMLRMGEDLEKALEASPGSTLPAESAGNDSYCAIASATDDLGNESELPEDDATCRTAPAGADALVGVDAMTAVWGQGEDGMAATDTSGQTLEFGVDTTVPAIDDIDGDMRYTEAPSAFSFDAFDDEGVASGDNLHSVPLMVRTQRRDASGGECLTIPDDGTVPSAADDRDCNETTDLAEDGTVTFEGPTAAYYTLWASARDQAGNRSAEVSHTFVFDNDAAEATAPAVPGIIDAGEAFQMAASLNDNLSIRDYYVTTDYELDNIAIELGVGLPKGVDDFDAASLTHRNHNILVSLPQPYKGLQDSPDDMTATAIAGVTLAVRDQTQANYGAAGGVPTTFAVEDPDGIDDDGFTVVFSDIDAVCVAEDEDDCVEANRETETTLEVVATADETGSFNNPFDGVDFWMMDVNGAHWKLPVTASAEAGRTDDRRRTWTYSVDVPAAMLRMMTREADFPPDNANDSHMVRAFAVDDGIAVTLAQPVTIDDGDDDN